MMLNVLLTHQTPAEVAAMVAGWEAAMPGAELFVAYGGPPERYAEITHGHKALIGDARLRTRDHQRERQSYCGVYSAVAEWLRGRAFTHVHLAEYDHIPLVPDLNARQVETLAREGADVMGFRVRRVDGTNYPNYLYHAADPRFSRLWQELSRRTDHDVVMRMFGTGCVWTRAAFEAVAARPEPFPIYLELYLPTLAHHLGYRVRDWGEQNRFVHHLGDFTGKVEQARREGGWSLHPVKQLWTETARAALTRG